jgi:ligand-binding sensor domain-containing protein
MLKESRRFLALCIILFSSFPVFAQKPENSLAFDIVNEKKGLSHQSVKSLWQDKSGFIWIGTEYGLNRYDGVGCIRYFSKSGGKSSIANDKINSVAEDANGDIWVGTKGGISRLNRNTGLISNYFTTQADKEIFGELNFNVFADKAGQMWAGNHKFLVRLSLASVDYKKYEIDCGQSLHNTRNYFILDLLNDSKGRFWLATSYGVKLFDTATGRAISYHFKEDGVKLNKNAIACLAESPDGNILAGTWGSGVLKYDEAKKQFAPYLLPVQNNQFDIGNIVLDIAFTNEKLYLATSNGLLGYTYPFEKNKPIGEAGARKYLPEETNPRSIPGDVVQKLLLDRAGDLWVATNNNLARADFRLTQFQHKKLADREGNPIIPATLLQPRKDTDKFLVGGPNLFLAALKSSTVATLDIESHLEEPTGSPAVWDMYAGKNGIWIAGTGGLLKMEAFTKTVTQKFKANGKEGFSLSGNRLWKVYEDKSGRLWVATIRHGICLINQQNGRISNFFTDPNELGSLHNKYVSNFFEDREGNIWFGSDDTLYKYRKKTASFEIIPLNIRDAATQANISGNPGPFLEDKMGKIWVALEHGVALFDPVKKTFSTLIWNEPFFKPVSDKTVIENGMVWFGTGNGLFRFDTAQKKLTRFTTRDGLISNEADRCLTLLSDGSIVLGSIGYLTRFFPEALQQRASLPPVVISKIEINGRDTALKYGSAPKLGHQSTIMFEFAALNFANAEQNQYQYMLAGADKDWNKVTEQRTVTYAKLPPGRYTFLVKGSNSDGVWNPKPVSFSFSIATPFYLRGWFIGLVLSIAAGLIFAFYRYRLAQALRVERMRSRLATDLHDDVGATLSAISMYTEALKRQVDQPQLSNLLSKIGEDSRETVVNMGDLVWAINPKNDSGDKLVQRMENYATDLCVAKELKLLFRKEGDFNDHSFGIEARRNIYLIFKEALNNALKYADASLITIKVNVESGVFKLGVEDNGVGFDAEKIMPGNGLTNMQTRAKEIKGQLKVISNPGKGCRVYLTTCPLDG